MNPVTRQDALIIGMGLDSLLECLRQADKWQRACGDHVASGRTRQLVSTILATRRKFVGEEKADAQIANALSVAEGLRDAAKHCNEGQTALHARLVGAAEAIEWLCRLR